MGLLFTVRVMHNVHEVDVCACSFDGAGFVARLSDALARGCLYSRTGTHFGVKVFGEDE